MLIYVILERPTGGGPTPTEHSKQRDGNRRSCNSIKFNQV